MFHRYFTASIIRAKMDAVNAFETPVNFYEITRRKISEDSNLILAATTIIN
jgi:hypothetical protein